MIPLMFEIRENVRHFEGFREKGFNTILKEAMAAALLDWHNRYARLHFKRAAYAIYPGAFKRAKRAPGEPLVETGHLRGKILEPKTRADIKGTYKTLRLTMQYGRPAALTDEFLLKAIFIVLGQNPGMTFARARNRVYAQAGYSAAAKAAIERGLPVMNARERKRFAHVCAVFIKRKLRLRNRAKRRTVIRG